MNAFDKQSILILLALEESIAARKRSGVVFAIIMAVLIGLLLSVIIWVR